MRLGAGIRAPSTEAAEALVEVFWPSIVLCRQETQGHVTAKWRVPTPPPSGVTEAVSELIDHTSEVPELTDHTSHIRCNVSRSYYSLTNGLCCQSQ
jgi:hypothetical protein